MSRSPRALIPGPHGVDEARGSHFSAGEHGHIDTDIYSEARGRLTRYRRRQARTRELQPPTRNASTTGDVTTPTQVRLFRADGREVRVIEANRVKALGTTARAGRVRRSQGA
jgi:hypothetical protein